MKQPVDPMTDQEALDSTSRALETLVKGVRDMRAAGADDATILVACTDYIDTAIKADAKKKKANTILTYGLLARACLLLADVRSEERVVVE